MVNFLDVAGCGGLEPIVRFIKLGVLPVLYIGIGIILIVLIVIDIAKAIVAGDEKEVKAAQKSAIRRVIYGVAIFFVVVLVNLVFGLLANNNSADNEQGGHAMDWSTCWNNVK